jgi:carbon storage regulator
MLVLTRRKDESIVIGGEVVVTVLGVDKNGAVRIGIDAPADVKILRRELIDEVALANQQATMQPGRLAAAHKLLRGRGGRGPAESDRRTDPGVSP